MDPRTREPDPDTMRELEHAADANRRAKKIASEMRVQLERAVKTAKAQGHSYSQIQKVTGLSLGAVQRMVK